MAEPQPGRPGGGGAGPTSATAATFQVNDQSLRELRKTWQGLTSDVKAFANEVRKLQQLEGVVKGVTSSARVAGQGGGRATTGRARNGGDSTFSGGSSAAAAAAGERGSGSGSGTGGGGPVGGGDGRAQNGGTSRFTPGRVAAGAALGGYAAAATYAGVRMGGISDNDLLYNQLGRASGGRYSAQDRRDNQTAATQWGGYQNMEDLGQGVRNITGVVGGTLTSGRASGGAGRPGLYGQAMTLGGLSPDLGAAGATQGVGSMYTGQSSSRLRAATGMGSLGPGGVTRSPTAIYDQVLRTVFRGRPFTAAMISEGMVPGAPLQLSLDYLLPDPNAQQLFRQYALARAALGPTNGSNNSRDTGRALRALQRANNGQGISDRDEDLLNRTGLRDNIRTHQNRLTQQQSENATNVGEMVRGGFNNGNTGLAGLLGLGTSILGGGNTLTGGLAGNAVGAGTALGGPLGSLVGALGGPTGLLMGYQTLGGRGGAVAGGQSGGAAGTGGVGQGGTGVQDVFVVNMPQGGPGGGGGGGGIGFPGLGLARGALGMVGKARAAAVAGGVAAAVGAGVYLSRKVKETFRAEEREAESVSPPLPRYSYFRPGDMSPGMPAMSKGGVVAGNHTRDDVAIKATPGELVVPLPVVGRFGGAKALMRMLGFSGAKVGGGATEGHYASGGEVSGRMADSELAAITGGGRLRKDAAAAFNRMVSETGRAIKVTDSYRDYAAQVAVKKAKPRLAAKPGTSNHGWGLALDLGGGIQTFGSEAHEWMRANAPKYGWVHPAWAQRGGSKPEAWHWEYGKGKANTGGGAAADPTADAAAASTTDPGKHFTAAQAGATATSELEALSGILSGTTGALRALGAAVKSQTSSNSGATPDTATTGEAPAPPTDISVNAKLGQTKAAARGWTGDEWASLHALWQKESGWNHKAANPSSSARGIPQAMMSAHFGKNWETSPEAKAWMNSPDPQIDWGLNYIAGRYKVPSKAWAHSKKHNWYEKGALDVLQDEVAQLHAGEMVVPANQAKKLRSMIQQGRRAGLESGVAPGTQTVQRPSVSLHIQAPVTIVGKATPADARDFLELVKREAEVDDTLSMIGAG